MGATLSTIPILLIALDSGHPSLDLLLYMTSSVPSSDAYRNWRIFLWFRVLFSARFYYPVLAVLFLDLGLTATQYTLLNVAWAAASLFSDVPAGVLADRIGRKPLLVAAGC